MKQFCPKCCKWYDEFKNICPECNVLMYSENECRITLNQDKALKIISLDLISGLNNWGWLVLLLGVAIGFASLFFGLLQEKTFGIILFFIGIATFITGIILIRKSRKLCKGKKLSEPPDNEYVKCPYCQSPKVTKLTSLDRASSFVVTGIASDNLGKQWHCNNCDSNF